MLSPQEREKYHAMYVEADRLLAAEMRGKVVLTPKALRIKSRRDEAEAILRADDHEGEQRLRHANLGRDYIIRIVAVPILADILDLLVCEIDDILSDAGCNRSVFSAKARQIHDLCHWITDRLMAASEMGCDYLANLALDNETLSEAVKKKVYTYISQRIKSVPTE